MDNNAEVKCEDLPGITVPESTATDDVMKNVEETAVEEHELVVDCGKAALAAPAEEMNLLRLLREDPAVRMILTGKPRPLSEIETLGEELELVDAVLGDCLNSASDKVLEEPTMTETE